MTKRTESNNSAGDRLSTELFDVIARHQVAGLSATEALTALYGVVYAVARQAGFSEMQLSNVLYAYADGYRDKATK